MVENKNDLNCKKLHVTWRTNKQAEVVSRSATERTFPSWQYGIRHQE